jgi:hypothetical protein
MDLFTDNLDKFLTIILLILISLLIRILLQVLGQFWIVTLAHTATLTLLPILTYVITSVISGNIALSLGLVGALSIVRFRNPVRSPLELSVYFGAITMGIAAAVSLKWLLFLFGSVLLAAISLLAVNLASKVFARKSFFTASFSEGNALSTLEITASDTIDMLETAAELKGKRTSEDVTSYVLASSNFETLRELELSLHEDSSVINTQLNK